MKRKELIEKWLEALESGAYKQGKSVLAQVVDKDDDVRYCCLGVLCNVYGMKMQPLIDECAQLLPKSVAKRAGLEYVGAFIKAVRYRGRGYESLAELNDHGVTFKTIARIIREQLAKNNFEKLP